jgi:hypothetical protein
LLIILGDRRSEGILELVQACRIKGPTFGGCFMKNLLGSGQKRLVKAKGLAWISGELLVTQSKNP